MGGRSTADVRAPVAVVEQPGATMEPATSTWPVEASITINPHDARNADSSAHWASAHACDSVKPQTVEPVTSTRPVASTRAMDTHHAPNGDLTSHWHSAALNDSAKPQLTIAEAVECNGGTPMVEPTDSDFFTEVEADIHLRPKNPVVHAQPRESAASQLRDSDVFQRRDCVSGSSSATEDSPPRRIHDLVADVAASAEIDDNLATEGVRSQVPQHTSVHGNAHGHRQQQRHHQVLDAAALPPRPDGTNSASTLPPRPEGTFGSGRIARAFDLRLPSLEQVVSSAQADVEREEEALRSARAKRLSLEREAQECRIRASPRGTSDYAISAGGASGAMAPTRALAADSGPTGAD